MDHRNVRLSHLSHGGGCGCKLAPALLQELLSGQPAAGAFANLLVGAETSDDAAVWRLNDETCIIATTDFFMPMVDDPFDFGRIAAANAISDVYAMGGRPIMALAILGMPLGKIAPEAVREILNGGATICAEAGIPVAGGHSIDCPEPVYGLVAIGTAKPCEIRRNSGARAGDALVLTKALGVGIYSAAFKKDALDRDAYAEMMQSVTRLNAIGAELARDPEVHAMTDVTGFGLLGHGLEMARASEVTLTIDRARLPLLRQAKTLACDGYVTGASARNWESYGDRVALPENIELWESQILTDPQTSGGLLVACSSDSADDILRRILAAGDTSARILGRADSGSAQLRVV